MYVGARSIVKAQEAIKEMLQKDSGIEVERLRPFVVDLGDLKAVKVAAEKLMEETDRLDVLVSNAGL